MCLFALLLAAASLTARLDTKVDELTKAGRFSGVVLVAEGGKPVYSRAEGFASVAYGAKNAPTTKFNLGSMNKMFTAVAIAQLQEQGKLAYTDKLGRFLPDYPDAKVREVTLHQLLTHTSGLGTYFNERFREKKDSLTSVHDHFQLFESEPLQFPPGSEFSYSNVGFILLGAVIEKISGQSYDDYLQEHVFAPAGMTETRAIEKNAIVPDVATGYTRLCKPGVELVQGDSPLCSNVLWLPYRGGPAGGGYSTAGDLLRFVNALTSGKLIAPTSLATLTTGKVAMTPKGAPPPKPGVSARYGYGFGDVTRRGLRSFGHTGGAPGIGDSFAIYPDKATVLIVLTNRDDQEEARPELSGAVEQFLRGEPEQQPKP